MVKLVCPTDTNVIMHKLLHTSSKTHFSNPHTNNIWINSGFGAFSVEFDVSHRCRPASVKCSTHIHGGGSPGDDWRAYLGHRVPHCADMTGDSGYELVADDSLQVAEGDTAESARRSRILTALERGAQQHAERITRRYRRRRTTRRVG